MEKGVWLALLLIAIPACAQRTVPAAGATHPSAVANKILSADAVANVKVKPAKNPDTVMKRPIELVAWLDVEDDKDHASRAQNTLMAKALILGADDVIAIEEKQIDGKTHYQGAAVKYGKKKVRMSKELDRLLGKSDR